MALNLSDPRIVQMDPFDIWARYSAIGVTGGSDPLLQTKLDIARQKLLDLEVLNTRGGVVYLPS